jgi:spermidine synthase
LPRSGPMLLAYALTLFVSALLLFLVQPLVGKLIVPLLGGFPAVWNTCLVFFQAMLLFGYAYAHYSTRWLGERRQAVIHLAVLLLPAAVLPLGISSALVPAGDANPIPGLLLLLLVSAGLPFFAVATTAPLLQRWLAGTAHPAARDPYFLYAASNVGSMLALLGYPTLVEPYLTLTQQRWAWSVGYGLLVLLLAACAVLLWKSPTAAPAPVPPKRKEPMDEETTAPSRRFYDDLLGDSVAVEAPAGADDGLTPGRALRWVALAFVPSSLMLGATTYITTDIAAIPLLWVLPLALYLLSFILVFSSLPSWVHKLMVLLLPVLLLLLVFLMVSNVPARMWTVILTHLAALFAVAMVCHGELARGRPAARQLTQFYLLMSLGGVLGGLFNALLAPLLFTSTGEYPLALVMAALLLPRWHDPSPELSWATRLLDFLLPAGVGLVALEFFGGLHNQWFPLTNKALLLFDRLAEQGPGDAAWIIAGGVGRVADHLGVGNYTLKSILCHAPPLMLCYCLVQRPLRFGLGLAAVLVVGALPAALDESVIYHGRSFFGVVTIRSGIAPSGSDGNHPTRRLQHGGILHGAQFVEDELRGEAITYYHRTGPMGQLFASFPTDAPPRDVAVIGLGTGTMAAYARPGDHYTFYEIDRKVKEVSFDQSRYFSYVQDAKGRGAEVDIVLGDARLSLDRERRTDPGRKFDLIVVDAFSSDAIPVHLMTREALQIYRGRLKEGGLIAFHTSNRYLRLEPVVANLAAAEGMAALMMNDRYENYPVKTLSTWVLVADRKEDFGPLPEDKRWQRPPRESDVGVWTDDYSNLLRVFDWAGHG